MSPDAPLLGFTALVALVAVQRLVELRTAKANERAARAAGALEVGTGHYPWMVILHGSFLVACALEAWLLRPPFVPALAAVMLVLLAGATALRYAAIRALGGRWTTRVFAWPEQQLVTRGPYRFLEHPNYLAVRIEIFALPLVHSAWITAAVFTILNAWLLRVRTAVEDDALRGGRTDPEVRRE